MSRGAADRIVWCLVFVFCGLINNVSSHPAYPVAECEKSLRKVLDKPKFTKLVETLMDNQVNASGLVYFELVFFHQLVTMHALGSDYVREKLGAYLEVDPNCDNVLLCAGMDIIIRELNGRQSSDKFHFVSQLFHQNNTVVTGLDACASERQIDFKRDPEAVLSDINEGYKEYCKTKSPYLTHKLSPKDVFYHMTAFKVTAGIYGDVSVVRASRTEFYDIDNKGSKVTWLDMPGPWWEGCYTPPRKGKGGFICPLPIQMFSSEINNGHFYMLYFTLITSYSPATDWINCFQYIFHDIRKHIDRAVNKTAGRGCTASKPNSITVPMIDLSTSYDLKTVLKDEIGPLFERNEMEGVSPRRLTMNDLLGWDYMSNRPLNFETLAEQNLKSGTYLRKPFVFIMVDKKTNIILKAGAFLRP